MDFAAMVISSGNGRFGFPVYCLVDVCLRSEPSALAILGIKNPLLSVIFVPCGSATQIAYYTKTPEKRGYFFCVTASARFALSVAAHKLI